MGEEENEELLWNMGTVSGPFSPDTLVCQYSSLVNPLKGVINGDNPFNYSFPIMLAQITAIFLVTRLVFFLTKPFRQSKISAEVLGGIILGPSLLGYYFPFLHTLFPKESRVMLHTVAHMGLIIQMFLLTLQMDTAIVRQAGKKDVLIGVMCVLLPSSVGWLACNIILQFVAGGAEGGVMRQAMPFVVAVNSVSSFPVITSQLADLKLLNSDIGRLATRVSVVTEICSFLLSNVTSSIGILMNKSYWVVLKSLLSVSSFLLATICVVRPLLIWLTRSSGGEKRRESMAEVHFLLVMLMVFACAFSSEILGQHYAFGPLLLGMVLPDGPPLGTELEQKVGTFCSGLFIPAFCAISGLKYNIFATGDAKFRAIIQLLIFITNLSKFAGTFVPALFCGVPLLDSFCFSLIMCSKGLVEIAIYCSWTDSKILDIDSFNLLLMWMLVINGVSRPMISFLYDPAKSYMTNRRRTILDSDRDAPLRVLLCVHDSDDVPMMMGFLETCNPTRLSPINVFVLHLVKLSGCTSALLAPYHELRDLKATVRDSEPIVNAFHRFEQQHAGSIVAQHLVAVSPYKGMHIDICTVAMDKRTSFVILPFHRQWRIGGRVANTRSSIRLVNQLVIEKAPCSVGILVDRGMAGGHRLLSTSCSAYRIALLFFGGDDDWEALVFCRRMAGHPRVTVAVVAFTRDFSAEDIVGHFRRADGKGKIQCEQATARNGEETIQVIRALEDAYDLVIVGRHLEPSSSFASGLSEWDECPELGIVGDMLASSDFRFSVLVIIQHRPLQPLEHNSGPLHKNNTSIPPATAA